LLYGVEPLDAASFAAGALLLAVLALVVRSGELLTGTRGERDHCGRDDQRRRAGRQVRTTAPIHVLQGCIALQNMESSICRTGRSRGRASAYKSIESAPGAIWTEAMTGRR
jgi:hypothetical protein